MDTASSTRSAATALEKDAPDIILPSSTSVFFIALLGVGGRASAVAFFKRNDSETAAAASAFAQCLTYAGHPNMPFCLIGRARTAESAAMHYLELLKQWGAHETGTMSTPRCECDALREEAKVAVGWTSGQSRTGSITGDGDDGSGWAGGTVAIVGVCGLVFGMVAGYLMSKFVKRYEQRVSGGNVSAQKRTGTLTSSLPFSNGIENSALLSGANN